MFAIRFCITTGVYDDDDTCHCHYIDQLEEEGLIDKDLSIAAKHSKLKGLLNPISIAGGLDNPLVEVEYRGKQSNVILTTQGESTLKIFGE